MPAAAVKVRGADIEEKQGLYSDFYRAKPRTFGMQPARGLVVRVSAKCVRGLGETRSLRVFRTELPPVDAERNRVASPDA